jgi:DTW domain-containing protein YfiP
LYLELDEAIASGRAFLLYPDPSARPAADMMDQILSHSGSSWTLIAIDGTWRQARYLYRFNARLQMMPKVKLYILFIGMG